MEKRRRCRSREVPEQGGKDSRQNKGAERSFGAWRRQREHSLTQAKVISANQRRDEMKKIELEIGSREEKK